MVLCIAQAKYLGIGTLSRFAGSGLQKNLELLRHDPLRTHVRTQGVRNDNAAIGLLVVFQDRQPGAPDGQAATVERVHQLALLRAFRPPADVGATRLVGLKVRAGRYLAIELLAGQPYFKIVSLG